jgi:hypothetical protein
VLRLRRASARALSGRERLADLRPGGSGVPGTAPFAPGAPADPALPSPPAPRLDYVAVTAIEYRLSLSRPLVNSGSVTLELRNKGEDPHDLVVTPDGQTTPVLSFPETDPGVYRASAANLSAGRYRLVCSLPGHEALGMSAVLRVE